MKISLVTLIIIFTQTCLSAACLQDHFEISPYVIMSNNKQGTLKFKLKENQSLKIVYNSNKLKINNGELVSESSLGAINCDSLNIIKFKLKGESYSKTIKQLGCDEIRFGHWSDTQLQTPGAKKRLKRAVDIASKHVENDNLHFLINTGDTVQNGGVLKEWHKFFEVATPILERTVNVGVVGNHAYYKNKSYNELPENFKEFYRNKFDPMLGNGVIDYDFFNLIYLNSSFENMDLEHRNTQWRWLKRQLVKAKKSDKYVVLAMHHAPFCSSFECNRSNGQILQDEMVPLIEKFDHVKLVLSGHLHVYERSEKSNINYVIAGPAGGFRGLKLSKNKYSKKTKLFTETFSVISATRDSLSLKVYNKKDEIIDELNLPITL